MQLKDADRMTNSIGHGGGGAISDLVCQKLSKICVYVRVTFFSETTEARILKLCIQMEN